MWKYVTRRVRDTFERSANHFDKRSSAGVVNNASTNLSEDKNKRANSPCCWFSSKKCWRSYRSGKDTNSKKWNFEHLNRNWIGAITWSGALVIGWYTSQLIHLKYKYRSATDKKRCPGINNLLLSLQPYVALVNKNAVCLNSQATIENIISNFTPTVHLVSNEHNSNSKESGSSSTSQEDSSNDLGDVLNSIENRLGLAAIENGQHQAGLNLLRSAANRRHAPAMYNLGLCYEMGVGVTTDEKMAMELYKSAAALEHPGALYNLGIYYGQGRGGLQRDTETAVRLLRLAAIQGQQDAVDALKSLDVNVEEPRDTHVDTWIDRQYNLPSTPFCLNEAIVPAHSTLFVENVNYLQRTCEAAGY